MTSVPPHPCVCLWQEHRRGISAQASSRAQQTAVVGLRSGCVYLCSSKHGGAPSAKQLHVLIQQVLTMLGRRSSLAWLLTRLLFDRCSFNDQPNAKGSYVKKQSVTESRVNTSKHLFPVFVFVKGQQIQTDAQPRFTSSGRTLCTKV